MCLLVCCDYISDVIHCPCVCMCVCVCVCVVLLASGRDLTINIPILFVKLLLFILYGSVVCLCCLCCLQVVCLIHVPNLQLFDGMLCRIVTLPVNDHRNIPKGFHWNSPKDCLWNIPMDHVTKQGQTFANRRLLPRNSCDRRTVTTATATTSLFRPCM